MTTFQAHAQDDLQQQLIKLQQHADEAAALMQQFANTNRLMIVCTLMNDELSVGELNERIPLSQSSLSQHLAGLRNAGLVSARREGLSVFYRLQGDHAIKVVSLLKELFCRGDNNVQECL